MKTVFLVFEILAILTQMYHNYWIVLYTSGLNNKWVVGKRKDGSEITISPKQIQAWTFCGIVDASIIFAMMADFMYWATAGVGILLAINIFYTYNVYEDYKNNKNLIHKASRRRYVAAYFVDALIPACVYVFAHLYNQAS